MQAARFLIPWGLRPVACLQARVILPGVEPLHRKVAKPQERCKALCASTNTQQPSKQMSLAQLKSEVIKVLIISFGLVSRERFDGWTTHCYFDTYDCSYARATRSQNVRGS